jgi:hypothetical protein
MEPLNAYEQAKKHPIRAHKPCPDFFEGAVLGNGAMGAVVTTRPDAILIHFGHNNVWDIRIAEQNQDKLGTFQEIFAKFQSMSEGRKSFLDDPWYREYCAMAAENYNKPYPRPMPCGSLLLGFDRREAEVLGHTLHLENGLCEVVFQIGEQQAVLQMVMEQDRDRLWLHLDGEAEAASSLFRRIKLIPDPETPREFPPFARFADESSGQMSFRQTLPIAEFPDHRSSHPKDKAFRLDVCVSKTISPLDQPRGVEGLLSGAGPFAAVVELEEGLEREVSKGAKVLPTPAADGFKEALSQADARWREFWQRSGVALEDEFLEAVWYRNLYFFNCAVKPGAVCPGLFANWSYRSIGSAWHGDYHMNYNTQQPFWVSFSSNHVEKHLAYADMVDHVLPVSRKWAKEYYGLRGAYFPHSAYPVEMQMMPYPVPHWGWEICETPWTVQSLWWHYLYTMDRAFLENRAILPMKEAVLFLVDYMKRPEAHGEQWGDDKYHIFPTVVPELYEVTPGFQKNVDCLVDLTLTKFVFRAFLQACQVLGRTEEEAELIRDVQDILHHFPEYPTAESKRGKVFVSVPGEDPEVVYNVPNSITTVFPGEEHGLHSPEEEYRIAVNSYLNHRNEGGNELVFYHMAGARLGVLDLERFKRQIAYCLLPNGTCTDRVLQAGGRYDDTLSFDFMARVGIWFENFALPAVINECLLQSYTGTIRLFPNWPKQLAAEFSTLRAVGGFLVSASFSDGEVQWIKIRSEAGAPLKFYIPWKEGAKCVRQSGEAVLLHGEVGTLDTEQDESIFIVKAS